MSATWSSWSRTAPGWAGEDRADRGGDHVGVGLGDAALRMKWTRQRCQAAPWRTVRDRGDEPAVGVGDDQLHASQATAAQVAENSVQNVSVSLSPTAQPRTSRCPSAATPVATTTAWETTRPLIRALQ